MRFVTGGLRCGAAVAALALATACSHDWDPLDPRLDGTGTTTTTATTGGTGGAGATTSTTGSGGTTSTGLGGAGGAGGAPPSHVVWAKSFGGALDQRGVRVATDAAGNVYLAGELEGELDLGGGPLVSAGGTDVFLAKLDADGNHVWSKSFGDGLEQLAHGLTVSPSGEVVLTGRFEGVVDFGGVPLASAGDSDGFVAVFDSAGAPVCSVSFGGPAFDMVTEVVAEDDGDLDVVGMFYGTIAVGPFSFTSGGDRDVFFTRMSSDGCVPFAGASFPGPGADYGWSIASVGGSDVLLGVDSDGSLDFGGGVLDNAGADDAFVPRLLGDGTHVWSRRFGDAQDQWAPHLVLAPGDEVVGAGSFEGTMDLGNAGVVTSAGGMDIYLMRLGADGTPLWIRSFGDAAGQFAEEIDRDAAGNVLITGFTQGPVDFGAGARAWGGGDDVFVAVLGPTGEHVFSLVAGDGEDQQGQGIASDPTGAILVTGHMAGTLDLGAGPMVSNGGTDVFVAKLVP